MYISFKSKDGSGSTENNIAIRKDMDFGKDLTEQTDLLLAWRLYWSDLLSSRVWCGVALYLSLLAV